MSEIQKLLRDKVFPFDGEGWDAVSYAWTRPIQEYSERNSIEVNEDNIEDVYRKTFEEIKQLINNK